MKNTSFGRWIASKPRWIVIAASATIGALVIGGGAYAASALSEPRTTVGAEPSSTPSAVASATPSPSPTLGPSLTPSRAPSATPSPTATAGEWCDDCGESEQLPFVLPVDGVDFVDLDTADNANYAALAVSPDDQYLVASLLEETDSMQVVIADLGARVRTAALPFAGSVATAWDPTKTHELLLAGSTPSGVALIAFDAASGAKRTIWTGDGTLPTFLSISSDGKFAAVSLHPPGATDLAQHSAVFIPLDGSRSTELGQASDVTFVPEQHTMLAHVPDGQGAVRVALLRAGSEPKFVGAPRGDVDRGYWGGPFKFNPAGTLAVYAASVDEYVVDVHIIGADGDGDRQLLDAGASADDYSWSRDGSSVMVVTSTKAHGGIVRANIGDGTESFIDGSDYQSTGTVWQGAWLPDDSGVIFGYNGRGDRTVYLESNSATVPGAGDVSQFNSALVWSGPVPPVWTSDGSTLVWALPYTRYQPSSLRLYFYADN